MNESKTPAEPGWYWATPTDEARRKYGFDEREHDLGNARNSLELWLAERERP